MSVATVWVRREPCTIASRGDLTWAIRISGLLYSQKTNIQKRYPGFKEDGKLDLFLSLQTAKENAPIDKELQDLLEGDLPPISLTTQLLKALAEMSYKIITSSAGANDSGRLKEFIWTLQG